MPTPSQIITTAAALMNDAAQTQYTNTACLPYLNLALRILQETFELNGIPVTNKTSTTLVVPANTSSIGYVTTPALPADLVEIQQLWESSPSGTNKWIQMFKREFIPHYLQDGTAISQFRIWAWKNQFIELVAANTIIDLKLDYTASIFSTITAATIDSDLAATNIETYLEFETAALCAMFIGENETRFTSLSGFAADALNRSLGIPIKGMQAIVTRRLPFRAAFKRRGIVY